MQRVRDGRDRGDGDTFATIAAHNVALQHLRDLNAERGLNPAFADALDSLLGTALRNGHGEDDFAMLARFMVRS
jgi:hypothetical protein